MTSNVMPHMTKKVFGLRIDAKAQRVLEISSVVVMSLLMDIMSFAFASIPNSIVFRRINEDLTAIFNRNIDLPLHVFFSVFCMICSWASIRILWKKDMTMQWRRRNYTGSAMPILAYTFISGLIAVETGANPIITILLLFFFLPFVIIANAVFRDEYGEDAATGPADANTVQ